MVQSPDTPHKLILIDGNAIMHRAFHALPPLTNADGQMTNAVYGFLSMLLTIIDKLSPTHLAVCFDRPEPTFRKSMYVGYQAHRPKMDDGLSGQFAFIQELLTTMNIPLYEKAGFEADDVIGTIAHQARDQLAEIVIVTGDRDILQLVNETVRVFMPIKGLSNGQLFGPSDVVKKYGVHPHQIVDYKALTGDASDNYPGVRGIGPKTAAALLQQFGTIENLYDAIAHADEKARALKEKTVKALSEYAEDAALSKELAKIRQDVPVTFDVPGSILPDLSDDAVIGLLQEKGFASIARRLLGVADEEKDQTTLKTADVQRKQEDTQNDSEQLSLM